VAQRVGLSAEEPERSGRVVDSNRPLREGRGVGLDEHEARVDSLGRCCHEFTWVGKRRLSYGVVLSLELEGNCVSGLSSDV